VRPWSPACPGGRGLGAPRNGRPGADGPYSSARRGNSDRSVSVTGQGPEAVRRCRYRRPVSLGRRSRTVQRTAGERPLVSLWGFAPLLPRERSDQILTGVKSHAQSSLSDRDFGGLRRCARTVDCRIRRQYGESGPAIAVLPGTAQQPARIQHQRIRQCRGALRGYATAELQQSKVRFAVRRCVLPGVTAAPVTGQPDGPPAVTASKD
jgi:hypothetical protein